MAKRTLKKKGKKEWYRVIAPDVFKNQELGEILAYEAKELIGRHIKQDYSVITGNPRDRNKNFTLTITSIVDKKARTEPISIIFSTPYVQRASGRSKTRAMHVGKYKTADDRTVAIKLYLLAPNKVTRSVNTSLLKKVDSLLKSKLSKVEAVKLFELNFVELLSKELKSKLKTIYPVRSVLFWKVLVE